jgi:glycosyltransferase involved in cell wall biosynthesis
MKGNVMEKVSVIMPVYNCEKFIKHSIESVQNQTYKNWELLIVDDGSKDGSLDIAKKYAEEDKRIRVFKMPKNSGVSVCRNLAVAKANGRYLAFIDSDDLWSANKLEHQIDFMQKHNATLSHTAYGFMDEDGYAMKKGKVDVDLDVDRKKYMKTTQIGMSSVMIDTQKVKSVKFPPDRKLCEDARLWMSYLREGMLFHGLNEMLVLYRIRNNQLSRNKMKMAVNTLKRYWNEKDIPACKRLYYFLNYATNGIRKRLKNTYNLDNESVKDFNCKQR